MDQKQIIIKQKKKIYPQIDPSDQPVRVNLKKYQKKDPLKFLLNTNIKIPKQKIQYSKKIVNDYVEIVNKRQDILDNIHESAANIQVVQDKTYGMFEEFYSPGSNHRQSINKLLSLIRPENKFIKAIVNQNQRKIDQFLASRKKGSPSQKKTTYNSEINQPHITLKTKKDKLFYLSDPKNMEILQQEQELVKQKVKSESDQFKDDQFTIQYKKMLQKEQEMEQRKQCMIQSRLFDSQLKYQGDDYIKQTIFRKNMKSLTPKSQSQEPISNNKHSNIIKISCFPSPNSVISPYSAYSPFKTQFHSRQISQYASQNLSNNSSTTYIPLVENIQESCNTVTEQVSSIKHQLSSQQKRSYKTFSQLIQKQNQVEQLDKDYFKQFNQQEQK